MNSFGRVGREGGNGHVLGLRRKRDGVRAAVRVSPVRSPRSASADFCCFVFVGFPDPPFKATTFVPCLPAWLNSRAPLFVPCRLGR